ERFRLIPFRLTEQLVDADKICVQFHRISHASLFRCRLEPPLSPGVTGDAKMRRMSLVIRPVASADYAHIEKLVIDSFEPITWQKKLDQQIGPLNGCDWRQRWTSRLQNIFRTQEVLVGEAGSQL